MFLWSAQPWQNLTKNVYDMFLQYCRVSSQVICAIVLLASRNFDKHGMDRSPFEPPSQHTFCSSTVDIWRKFTILEWNRAALDKKLWGSLFFKGNYWLPQTYIISMLWVTFFIPVTQIYIHTFGQTSDLQRTRMEYGRLLSGFWEKMISI